MSAPDKLSRPLAARVAALSDPPAPNPAAPLVPENVIAAAVDALRRGETHYTDRPGILALRTLAADGLRTRFGLNLSPKDVTITCGATEARFAAIKLLAAPGSGIVCPGDQDRIAGAAWLAGAALSDQPTDATSILYLTPADDRSVIDKLLALVSERGWWVIWDLSAVSSEQRGVGFHPGQLPGLLPRVVTIESLSDWLPGWRVGWMAGSEAAERLRTLKQSLTICTTNVSQWAAAEWVKTHES